MELKQEFYSSLNTKEAKKSEILLKKFFPSEEQLGKDLIFFTTNELLEANKKIPVLAQYQSEINKALLKYFAYGTSKGYIEKSIINSDAVVLRLYEKDVGKMLVKSPYELSRKFIEWFPTIHMGTPECQYATILWLYFKGFSTDDILNIKIQDVGENSLTVGGETHIIPPSIIPFVLKTRDAKIFNIYRKEGEVCNSQKRCDNGMLIRTWNTLDKKKFKNFMNSVWKRVSKTGFELSANALNLSGICWETKQIEDETGILSYNIFASKQNWNSMDYKRAWAKRKYAKYDYANYIRTFYPDESK